MASFALRRILQSIVIVILIAVAVFLCCACRPAIRRKIRAPVFARPDVIEQYRHEFGTDRPLLAQLAHLLLRRRCTAISASPSASRRLS